VLQEQIADEPAARPSLARRGAHRPASAPDGRVFPAPARRIAAEALGVALVAWVLATVLLRLWDAPLHLAFTSRDGDLNQTLMTVKSIVQTGWILHQPRLGAPFGQSSQDFPQGGESAQFLLIKLLAQGTSSPGLIVNVYYLAGFGLIAAVAFLVLRHLRFAATISAAVALPFAFLPYRTAFHAEEHLTRANYLTVPLAFLVLAWTAAWRSWFLVAPADGAPGRPRWQRRRVAFALASCVLIGSWETMTAIFTLVLLATATVVGALRWRDGRRLLVGGAGCLVIGATFLGVNLPSLLYWLARGRNLVAAHRIVAEAEMYGLKLNRVVLPSDGSRLHLLTVLGLKGQAGSPVPSEPGQSIGILLTLGLLGALYTSLAGTRAIRRGRAGDPRPVTDRGLLGETLGLGTVTAVLFGTVGGFATLVSMAGLVQARTWNRIVLFLAFFAVVQLAIWFERAAAWAGRRVRRPRLPVAVVLVAVCALALADGPPLTHAPYPQVVAQDRNDRTIVTAIERVMPRGTAVLQVPYLGYPESYPPGTMVDYDPLRPFLADAADGLRWSYGGIAGRPQADWQQHLVTGRQIVADLPAILGMGFTGLWLDCYGFPAEPHIDALMRGVLQVAPLVSPDGRYLFYDLRPYRRALGRTDAQLRATARQTFGIAPPG